MVTVLFVVLLMVAVLLVAVVLLWRPGDRVTPEKARLIRGSAGIGAILLFIAAGTVMLGGMQPVKGKSSDFEAYEGSDEEPVEGSSSDDQDANEDEKESPPGAGDDAESDAVNPTDDSAAAEPNQILNDPGPPEPMTPEGADGTKSAAERIAEAKVGSLSKESIQNSVEALKPFVKDCYENTLKDFPDAEGKVVIGFTIIAAEDGGRVELSELDAEETTLFDTRLHDCMLEEVGNIDFDTPGGDGKVKVRYPFDFTNGDAQ